MGLDRLAIDKLRNALERTHSSATTSSLLFEALAGWRGPVPSTTEELHQLVHGPLTETLIRRVGAGEAKRQLTQILEAIETPAAQQQKEEGGVSPGGRSANLRPDPDTTQAVPIARDPVEVAVLGSSEHFAHRLLAVLGPRRIRSRPFTEAAALRALDPTPALVVIDSHDFPASEPTAIAEAISTLPSTTTTLLWGAHLPYGRMVSECFAKKRMSLVPLTQEHGIAPLLDLIRSRRQG